MSSEHSKRTEIKCTNFFAGGEKKRAELAEPACNCTCICNCICGPCDCVCACDCDSCICVCYSTCNCNCDCSANPITSFSTSNDVREAGHTNDAEGVAFGGYSADLVMTDSSEFFGMDNAGRNGELAVASDNNLDIAAGLSANAPQE